MINGNGEFSSSIAKYLLTSIIVLFINAHCSTFSYLLRHVLVANSKRVVIEIGTTCARKGTESAQLRQKMQFDPSTGKLMVVVNEQLSFPEKAMMTRHACDITEEDMNRIEN